MRTNACVKRKKLSQTTFNITYTSDLMTIMLETISSSPVRWSYSNKQEEVQNYMRWTIIERQNKSHRFHGQRVVATVARMWQYIQNCQILLVNLFYCFSKKKIISLVNHFLRNRYHTNNISNSHPRKLSKQTSNTYIHGKQPQTKKHCSRLRWQLDFTTTVN